MSVTATELADLGLRLGLIAQLVELGDDAQLQVERWITELGGDWDGVELHLTVAAEQRRVAYRVEGGDVVLQRLDALARSANVPGDYLAELEEVHAWFDGERLAGWLELTAGGMDMGWTIGGPVALDQIWSLPGPGDTRDRLRAACEQRQITSAESLGRNLGDGPRMTLLELAPPGADVVAQINEARRMLDELAVEPLPDRALQGMLSMSDGPATMRIWLAGGEAARVGVVVPAPSTELTLMLREQVGLDDHEGLALLEGTLGTPTQRLEVELLRDADGLSLELTYRVR